MIWSLALAVGGVLGLYLAGRKNYWGWAIGLAMQALWVAYAIVTEQYGFLLSAAAYGWVYGLNLARWVRPAKPAPGSNDPGRPPKGPGSGAYAKESL